MDFVAILLLLWFGFGLLIWAMRDSLKQAENEIEINEHAQATGRTVRRPRFCAPQDLTEPIGSYLDKQIYQYAVIEGRQYRFDHVCPKELAVLLSSKERFVAPGLVYVECPQQG